MASLPDPKSGISLEAIVQVIALFALVPLVCWLVAVG